MATTTPLSSLPSAVIEKLLAGPALRPPPGHIPDFAALSPAHSSIIASVVVSQVIFFGLLIARLIVQLVVIGRLALEDFVIIVAVLFHVSADTASVILMNHGQGKHMWDLTLEGFIQISHVAYYYGWMYILTIGMIKVAILLQLIRILAPKRGNKIAWAICWIGIVINALFYLSNALLQILHCLPVKAAWDVFSAGYCIPYSRILYSNAIFGIITDLITLAIPVPIILKLKMSRRKKFGVMAVFATGTMACVASIVRLYYNYKVFSSPDTTYYQLYLGIWCTIEMDTAMVVFNAPILPQLWHLIKRTIQGRHSPTSPSSGPDEAAAEHIETSSPKIGSRMPYEMPSLASFEEPGYRGARPPAQMEPVFESRGGSSAKSGETTTTASTGSFGEVVAPDARAIKVRTDFCVTEDGE